MRRVLILDTETTGIEHGKDSVIEVAAMVYGLEHATVLECYSAIVSGFGNPAVAINRIPEGAVVAEGTDGGRVWERVAGMSVGCGAVLAHHAEFDRGFTPPGVFHQIGAAAELPWICTEEDLVWPRQQKLGSSLVALALAHDLGVAYAHRALADCDLIARLLTRSRELGADLDAMLERGLRPKALFQALVPYERKDEAKDRGFRWEGDRKRWVRRMAIEDAKELPFPTRQVAA